MLNTIEVTLHNMLNKSRNVWDIYELLYINQILPEKMQLNLERLFLHFPEDKEPFLYAALHAFEQSKDFTFHIGEIRLMRKVFSDVIPDDVEPAQVSLLIQKYVIHALKEKPLLIDALADSLMVAVRKYNDMPLHNTTDHELDLRKFSDKTRQKPLYNYQHQTHLGVLSFIVRQLQAEYLNPRFPSEGLVNVHLGDSGILNFIYINSIDLTPSREEAANEALSYLIAILGLPQVQAIFNHYKFTQIHLSPNTPKRNALLKKYGLARGPEVEKTLGDTIPEAEATVSTDPAPYAVEDLLAEILLNENIKNKLEAMKLIIDTAPKNEIKLFNPQNPVEAVTYPYGINRQRYPFESLRMMQLPGVKEALITLLAQIFQKKNTDTLNSIFKDFTVLHTHGEEPGVLSYFDKPQLNGFYHDCYKLAKNDVLGFLDFYKHSLARLLSDSERELLLTTKIGDSNENIITALFESNTNILKPLFATFENAMTINRLTNNLIESSLTTLLQQHNDYTTSLSTKITHGFENIALKKIVFLCEYDPHLIKTLQQWAEKHEDAELPAALKQKFPGQVPSGSYSQMRPQLKAYTPTAAPTTTALPARPAAKTPTTSASALRELSLLTAPNEPLVNRDSAASSSSSDRRVRREMRPLLSE